MIHPRRLKGSPANLSRYYTVGDYYSKGAEEHSQWGGAIAEDLGLEGKVDPATFRELLAGRVANQQLGRHRTNGEIEHHPGWDFSVNAPKSISIMALVAGDERIAHAHEHAVGSALAYLEAHASLRRREDGKIVHETTGRLIYARFTEHASRELDPHLHTHVVVMNMTNRGESEQMASLESRAMYAEQMVAGQVYRNDLAHRVRELGYAIDHDPRSGLFEIRGVSPDLIRSFSQRSEHIDTHAKEHGLEGQAARRRSFYATRSPKMKLGTDALSHRWNERSLHHAAGLTRLAAEANREGQHIIATDAVVGARASLFGIRQAESREAVNNLGRMIRLGLASHVGEVRLADVLPLLAVHEERRKLLATRAETGDQIHTRGRTTRRTARLEQALSRHLALALDDAKPIAPADRLLPVLEEAGLSPAQEQALVHAGLSRDRVTAIHGVAGSGKSTLVNALNLAATPDTVLIAIAPTSSAAAGLGQSAKIPSRTVASLLAGGGHDITASHVLMLDEAGQLGNRQALRVLEISRMTGARLVLLGDNKQTGAIEQGKAFWLLQRLGMATAELKESVRQQTKSMKAGVSQARSGDYSSSLASLDKVVSGFPTEDLANLLVEEWTRLKPASRATTNILVLDNASRLIVNGQIREALKREGTVAAQDAHFHVLTSAGFSDHEKHFARFYSVGQVVTFGRDMTTLGIARDSEYRVTGLGRDRSARQLVKLADEHGRVIDWDPRRTQARQINVFNRENRDLARGDRIQWRLVSKDLGLKNAERGTVQEIAGSIATIRWDRDERVQDVDLSQHKTWDHGFSETVYSSQSKTYDRVYVLAPVNSSLVNGKNYYTAITRARYGVKLWTENEELLVERLAQRSGEKTSALEGLGRLDRDRVSPLAQRHRDKITVDGQDHRGRCQERHHDKLERFGSRARGEKLGVVLAGHARQFAVTISEYIGSLLARHDRSDDRASALAEAPVFHGPGRAASNEPAATRGHER